MKKSLTKKQIHVRHVMLKTFSVLWLAAVTVSFTASAFIYQLDIVVSFDTGSISFSILAVLVTIAVAAIAAAPYIITEYCYADTDK